MQKLQQQGVDAILVDSVGLTAEHVRRAQEWGLPILYTGQKNAAVHCLKIDDAAAGHRMGAYLRQMGHKHAVFAGVTESDEAVGIERKAGFVAGFCEGRTDAKVDFVETGFDFLSAYNQAEEMYRRMVFNVVARNQDDHTKNISFLMDKKGKWRLSPAYDVSWSYNPKGEWTSQHQMSINNKWTDITINDLLAVATAMNIKKPRDIIEKVIDVVAHWPNYATSFDIPKQTIEAIQSTLITKL